MLAEERINKRYGRLIVIGVVRHKKKGHKLVLCLCECGEKSLQETGNLKKVQSCGCLKAEGWKHGGSRSAEYYIWESIVQRCTNPNCKRYPDYGGRGITLADRWLDFRNFIADVGKRPSPELTIERVDNSRGYTPGNVVWASRHVQTRNTRVTWNIRYLGETRCITDWAADPKCAVSITTLRKRLLAGWPMRDAMLTPPRKVGRWIWRERNGGRGAAS